MNQRDWALNQNLSPEAEMSMRGWPQIRRKSFGRVRRKTVAAPGHYRI